MKNSIVCNVLLAVVLMPATIWAQSGDPIVKGYITSLDPPSKFTVEGKSIVISDATTFATETGKDAYETDVSLRQALQVSEYVLVWGTLDHDQKTIHAESVHFRDDNDNKLAGFGVIDKVLTPSAFFQADGYRIRITAETKTMFEGDLKSLENVQENIWVRYKGKRDENGDLLASDVTFFPGKSTNFKALKGIEVNDIAFRPKGSDHDDQVALLRGGDAVYGGKVKINLRWRTISSDVTLQNRVEHIGMNLVPAFQKDMPSDNPSKIDFRFYVIDMGSVRDDIGGLDGLIFIPEQVVQRLENDSQLAAVLADGIAENLQRQTARIVEDNRATLGTLIASDVAGAIIPFAGLPGLVGSNVAAARIQTEMMEQRGRVALQLLFDAGYDPWQAPVAWRLLGPKREAKDPDSLKDPRISDYQYEVLNLQYKKSAR